MRITLPLFLLVSLIFSSCKEDTTPSWLIIDEVDLTTNEAYQGSNSHGITDVWVYMDNEPLGVFDLPAKIPILDEGTHEFKIYAGVKVNGISSTRAAYPFYERYEVSLDLVKGEKQTIVPQFTYKSNAKFAMNEDFEDVGVDFSKDDESDTAIVVLAKSSHPDIVAYGNGCGAIYLTETDSIFKGVTSNYMDLPQGGSNVFMEIDFKNTNSLAMGVIAQNSTSYSEHTPLVIMNPQDAGTDVWKKMYINLTEDISYEIYATSFELYLLGILDPELTSGYVYIDNIKVVYLE